MLKKTVNILFFFIGGYVGLSVFRALSGLIDTSFWPGEPLSVGQEIGMSIFFAIIFGFIFYRLLPAFTTLGRKIAGILTGEMKKVSANKLVFGTLGLILGFVIAFLLSLIYMQIDIASVGTVLTIITYVILGYIGVVILSEKGTEIFNQLYFEKRLSTFGGKLKERKGTVPKILDTSVIIDGRILDILKTGFLEGPIIIPEFVLVELRHIADSSDSLKRKRGRRGLDILNKIQSEYGIEIYNTDSEKTLDEIPEVDVKLLKLAQIMKGNVVTNDFNLNKVAKIKEVKVLNINELANAIKPIVLPDEIMEVSLVKAGKEKDQALAYLDDGTMIVVEGGKKYIGSTIKIRVGTVLQTAAGRMIFGKPEKV